MQPLTYPEAQDKLNAVREHLSLARTNLAELYRRQGHQALGYTSWKAMVKAELGKSLSWFYRQVQAWEVEESLSLPSGTLPERATRELAKLDADVRSTVYSSAALLAGSRAVTAADIAHVVESIRETLVTGVYTDAEGNQISAADLVAGDAVGRAAETKARVIERLNGERTYLVKAKLADIDMIEPGLLRLHVIPNGDIPLPRPERVMVSVWLPNEKTAE